jgi:23S rRNA (guanosine2251-2'-O)-methyltransferase
MRKLKNEELNRITVEDFKNNKKIPLVIILDNVRSLNNVGSAFRTSDAFLIEKICLCGITGTPPHREIHKTALGATDSVNWEYYNQTIEAVELLRSQGYTIIAIEQAKNSLMLDKFYPVENQKYAFIFGNEVFGVDEKVMEHIDQCIEIPQFGTKHSLNISVSIGITIWDFFSKLHKNQH